LAELGGQRSHREPAKLPVSISDRGVNISPGSGLRVPRESSVWSSPRSTARAFPFQTYLRFSVARTGDNVFVHTGRRQAVNYLSKWSSPCRSRINSRTVLWNSKGPSLLNPSKQTRSGWADRLLTLEHSMHRETRGRRCIGDGPTSEEYAEHLWFRARETRATNTKSLCVGWPRESLSHCWSLPPSLHRAGVSRRAAKVKPQLSGARSSCETRAETSV
jgi:hypothetical protein